MKIVSAILLGLLVAAAAVTFTGCATTDGGADSDVSALPWNQPAGWEGPMPSTINQGR